MNTLTIRLRLLGRPLAGMRRAAGLTQHEIAETLGYSTAQFVSNWERGVAAPPIDALPYLAGLFKIRATAMVDLVFRCEAAVLRERKKLAMAQIRDAETGD